MIGRLLSVVAASSLLVGVTQAAPIRVSPDPSSLESGLEALWVDVSTSPHSITDAENALIGAGGFTIVNSVDQVVGSIDVDDSVLAKQDPLTALGDDNFAVNYTGYLRIDTDGNYQFRMTHDDGIRVVLGGETIIDFPTDTSPIDSDSAILALAAGYYTINIIGWEQGGQFVNRFSLLTLGGPTLVTSLFHDAVPAPGTVGLVALGLLLVSASRRNRIA
jgi:PA14 domain